MREVFTVTERNGKNYWTKIGAAFDNTDGSVNVVLNALPINGKLVIKDPLPPREDNKTDDDPTRNW